MNVYLVKFEQNEQFTIKGKDFHEAYKKLLKKLKFKKHKHLDELWIESFTRELYIDF